MGPGRLKIILQSIMGFAIVLLLTTFLYSSPTAENLKIKLKGIPVPTENGTLDDKEVKYQFARVIWDSIKTKVKCPKKLLKRVGGQAGDGGKWTCGVENLEKADKSGAPCVIYSFGVSDDSSWEAEVLEKTNHCFVYAYDPTVSVIGIPLLPSNPRVHFQPLGIGGDNSIFWKRRTLKTLMEENGGHRFMAVLKMDVEGAEFSSLNRIFEDFPEDLPFAQFLVEIHVDYWDARQLESLLSLFRRLEGRGLYLFYKEVNPYRPDCCAEFSFLNTRNHQWSSLKLESN